KSCVTRLSVTGRRSNVHTRSVPMLNAAKQSMAVAVCLAAAVWAVSVPQAAQAQVLYGTIVGNVTDPSGAAIPGATVTVTKKQTNQSREAITNEAGNYTLSNVLAGSYEVKISLAGFKQFDQTDVVVTLNTVTRVDAALQV